MFKIVEFRSQITKGCGPFTAFSPYGPEAKPCSGFRV